MAVCALTMLDGMEDEVTIAGGVLLLILALILAWVSTHVADRGDHILGTILTVGAHASLIGLGSHDSYSGGTAGAVAPEEQSASSSQENKPDDGDGVSERGEGEGMGEGANEAWTDLLLDIQSKNPPTRRASTLDEEDNEAEEEEKENEEDEIQPDEQLVKPKPVLTSINVRLKYLNDTEEVAIIEPEDTVAVLKRKYFSGREQQIKLIYQGQLLQDPKSLFSLNITDNSVIHCHISPAAPRADPAEEVQPGNETGSRALGRFRAAGVAISSTSLLVPVFVVMLSVVWYFRINYRQFFTAPATISLVAVTVLFSCMIFGMHSR